MGTRTSPFLQEKLTLLGANQIFAEVPNLVESLLGIQVSESQTYRVVQKVSQTMEDPCLPSSELRNLQAQTDQQVYAMVDGSFLFTDYGWKEIKLGRVFQANPDNSCEFKWTMGPSEYVAQRGHYEAFTSKFENLQLVSCKKDWFDEQKSQLIAGRIDIVCATIKELKPFEGKIELLNYLENNSFRMKYDEYRKKGLMISSGPIESAHRTVLQSRMKRSGQRWSNAGCDAIIKLRIAYQSGKKSLITNTFSKQAA